MAEPASEASYLPLVAASDTLDVVADTASTTGRNPVKILPLENDTGTKVSLDPFATDPNATFPQDGFITVKGSTVTYTPAAGFVGTDSFDYSVHDKAGDTGTGTIAVTVTDNALPTGAVAPDAVNDSFTVDSPKAAKLDVLLNDTSSDGSKLFITSFNEPDHGTLSLKGSQLTYHAESGYTGPNSFSYEVYNKTGLHDAAQVSLDVRHGGGAAARR